MTARPLGNGDAMVLKSLPEPYCNLTPAQLAAKCEECRRMADVAEQLARQREGSKRKMYLDMAARWRALADEIDEISKS